MVEAIVLAGGESSRMRKNKMLLPMNGRPLIMSTIQSLYPFVNKVIVVTGKYHDDIIDLVKDDKKITCVRNHNYALGMFESIKVGVQLTKEDFFIIPGDLPKINPSTYKRVLESDSLVRVAAYNGKKGHPIFIDKSLKSELLSSNLPHLKAFRDQYEYSVIDVNDSGVLEDIDTADDYQTLLKR